MDKAYQPNALNEQASVLVDAQTDIKIAIKNGVLSGTSSFVIKLKIREIINKALRRITSPALRENAQKSLMLFADTAYSSMRSALPNAIMAVSVFTLMKAVEHTKEPIFYPKNYVQRQAVKTLNSGYFHTMDKGLPIRDFDPLMKRVKNALNELAMARAVDADDVTGRNSLRSFAEMQVRYERHLEEIKTLKNDGHKLVVCSVHADCSDRCKRWQGRVYSLAGSYGKTADGRSYVPLQIATDVYYATKAGRTYKNGLLGFYCRHRLFPYREGMIIPRVTEAERKKEDAITKKQRAMERAVIRYREEALMQKDVDFNAYKLARKKALTCYQRYKDFSKANGRAYYPDRVKIL